MAEASKSAPRDAVAQEYMSLLEDYFQTRETEDAHRAKRVQIAVRLKVLGAHMDGGKASRIQFAKTEEGEG